MKKFNEKQMNEKRIKNMTENLGNIRYSNGNHNIHRNG